MAYRDINDRVDVVSSAGPRFHNLEFKRGFDVAFALIIAPLVLPIIGLLWCLVRLDGGPGFFGHMRVGESGREFRCLKIRSMVQDAEARLNTHLEQSKEARDEWAQNAKLKDDPRITKLGRFLRKSSLDELPQIFNVLKGEMSFVGPRPVPKDELIDRYGSRRLVYEAMKPGITGLWQVSGRNDVSYAERIALDERYLTHRSFGLDIKIILKTASAVIGRTGQ